MRNNSKKQIRSLTNIHQSEILLKTQYSTHLLYSNQKQRKIIQSYSTKKQRSNKHYNNNNNNKYSSSVKRVDRKNGNGNNNSNAMKIYNMNYNYFPSTPKTKTMFQSKGTLGYLNINYLAPISNSVKNSTKQIINYNAFNYNHHVKPNTNVNANDSGSNTNLKKNQLTNSLSLFTINENTHHNEFDLKNTISSPSSKQLHMSNLAMIRDKGQSGLLANQSNNNNSNLGHFKKKKVYNYTPKKKSSNMEKYIHIDENAKSTGCLNPNNNKFSNANAYTNTTTAALGITTRNDKTANNNHNNNDNNSNSPKQYLSINKDKQNNNKHNYSYSSSHSNKKHQILRYETKYPIYNSKANSNSNNNNKQIPKPKQKQAPSYNLTLLNNKANLIKTKDLIPSSKASKIQNAFLLKLSSQNNTNNSNPHYNKNNSHKDQYMTIKVNRKVPQNKLLKKAFENTSFIRLYAKYLSQNEIEELKQFKHLIYYHYPFNQRQKDNKTYLNEITFSFSYQHCPNYTVVSYPRSHSHKSLNEINSNDALYYSEYNDEEGNYILNQKDHILYRYEIIALLGVGSFGQAVKCLDHKTNEVVCIKIIKANSNLFTQAMTEVKILNYLMVNANDNESNIVKFISHFMFRGHICLVFEELDIDLYEYLKLNNYSGFEMNQIRSYATSLLFTLLFLKRQQILHCDLKPENILLTKGDPNTVKVIDFGSSCFDYKKVYTYIQSRFYRAPEIILDHGYSFEIDMWSLGCIIAELYTGSPILPGENERDQLRYIIDYLGLPSDDYINRSSKKEYFFDRIEAPYSSINSDEYQREPKRKSISGFLIGASREFIDFIKNCLQWEPKDRMKPEEALMNEWVICNMSAKELSGYKKKIELYVKRSDGRRYSSGSKGTGVSYASTQPLPMTQLKTRNVTTECRNVIIQGKRTKSKDSYCYSYNRKNRVKERQVLMR